jgi:sialidase-1
MPMLDQELQAELTVPYLEKAERIVAVTGGGYWPTLFKLKDGSLAAVVRGGAPHVGLNSRLDMIRSMDGGKTWTKNTIVPPIKGLDVRGSSSGITADGTVVVVFCEHNWYASGKFNVADYTFETFYIYSRDNGKTWSPKQLLPRPANKKLANFGRIFPLHDKLAIMSTWGFSGDKEFSALMRSQDNGRTWGNLSIIAEGFNETSIIKLPDGRMLAVIRSRGGHAHVCQSESKDDGYTWSRPVQLTKTDQHPADYALLKSGNLLLTYGNRIGDLIVGGMLSYDLGKTWDVKNRFIIQREGLMLREKSRNDLAPEENLSRRKTHGDCGYPSTVCLDDGTIVTICYSLGSTKLSKEEQQECLQYERDAFERPPASEKMRRFEYGLVVRYTEDQITSLHR